MSNRADLERFSVPTLAHTGLFGTFLAVHAVGDALQVLHAGVGCKGKTQRQLVHHDLGAEAHTRVGWTELTERDLIKDPVAPLLRAARELQSRRDARVLFVTLSAAVATTGSPFDPAVEELERELGCPVVLIPSAVTAGDLWQGYAAVVHALLGRVDWSRPPDEQPTVSQVGYLFHRHEMEQAANLGEVGRLCEALGLRSGPCFLGGQPLARLLDAAASRALVCWPYATEPDKLAAHTGRDVREAPLPLGRAATAAWLRSVGRAGGVDPTRVERLIAQEDERCERRITPARRRLQGRRVAIVADTPLAAALVVMARELDLVPGLVALLDRSFGGAQGLRRQVDLAGGTLPDDVVVVEHPTLLTLRDLAGGPTPADRRFDLAIRPDLALAGSAWQGIPTVELGFPATHKHFVYPQPELGYAGAVALAQRLLDATAGVW